MKLPHRNQEALKRLEEKKARVNVTFTEGYASYTDRLRFKNMPALHAAVDTCSNSSVGASKEE